MSKPMVNVSLRCSGRLKKRVVRAARKRGISQSVLVNNAMLAFIATHRKTKGAA